MVSLAACLSEDHGDALCFKGGFVLRHVHGYPRFSKDVDGTRHQPPKHPFDADEIIACLMRVNRFTGFPVKIGTPRRDSASTLDLDTITYQGHVSAGSVTVEISYREPLTCPPIAATIGPPYYDPFPVWVMAPDEIVAEKLRALAQRDRVTDLSDIARLVATAPLNHARIADIVPRKFTPGVANPAGARQRIHTRISDMRAGYADQIAVLDPTAPDYITATSTIRRHLDAWLTRL